MHTNIWEFQNGTCQITWRPFTSYTSLSDPFHSSPGHLIPGCNSFQVSLLAFSIRKAHTLQSHLLLGFSALILNLFFPLQSFGKHLLNAYCGSGTVLGTSSEQGTHSCIWQSNYFVSFRNSLCQNLFKMTTVFIY